MELVSPSHCWQTRSRSSQSSLLSALILLLRRWSKLAAVTAVCLATWTTPASAQLISNNGCVVLLCLAGNWRDISACVPPVRRALRDLVLGRSLPLCNFASPGSIDLNPAALASSDGSAPASSPSAPQHAVLRWASGDFCPPQYRFLSDPERGNVYDCSFRGAIEVTINGQLWNRTWWDFSGETVTEWTAASRASMPAGSADDRFERDFQEWQQRQQEAATPIHPETAG